MYSNAKLAGNQDHYVYLVVVRVGVIFAVYPIIQPRNQEKVSCDYQQHEDYCYNSIPKSTSSLDEQLKQLVL